MVRRLSPLLVVLWPLCVVQAADEDPPSRYLAVMADGTRVEGMGIFDWHRQIGAPRLDSTNLQDENRPLRWLCDLSLRAFKPGRRSQAFVELIGGDRLPGRVVGFQQGETGSATNRQPHLLVTPTFSVTYPGRQPLQHVRVLVRCVRRVFFAGSPRAGLEPGTLFFRDGRRLSYRSLRWESDSVTLLLKDGLRRVALADLAEIHLPRRDAWRAYYETLAVLGPDCSTRLMRLETTNGLIATASAQRFRVASSNSGDMRNWYHMVQPAWSLDPIWIHFPSIRTRLYFSPHEVPLSWLHPVEVVQRSILGGGWHWRADRNVQGGILRSDGQLHGWGFGVHAASELSFELPEIVEAFRSRVGLDGIAGDGGCARVAVYVDHTSGDPLYRSDHLIGSDHLADTGLLPLAGPAADRKLLILAADFAHHDRPTGTDPLDIRDVVDWIEPVLLLDIEKLKSEVRKVPHAAVPAWEGWTAEVEGGGMLLTSSLWDDTDHENPRYVVQVDTQKHTLTLSTQQRISAGNDCLRLQLRQLVADARPGRIEVRADGRPIARIDPLEREPAAGLWIPLGQYRGRQVEIEVLYSPGDEKGRTEWQSLEFAQHPEG